MLRQIETPYRTRLGPGGLYGAISRLEAKGLISARPMEERHRPYQITEAGLRLLRAQLNTMTRLTNRGSAPAEPESPLPIPSFYVAESDEEKSLYFKFSCGRANILTIRLRQCPDKDQSAATVSAAYVSATVSLAILRSRSGILSPGRTSPILFHGRTSAPAARSHFPTRFTSRIFSIELTTKISIGPNDIARTRRSETRTSLDLSDGKSLVELVAHSS
jgi:DNA-binding PadR family transcriptional regulator